MKRLVLISAIMFLAWGAAAQTTVTVHVKGIRSDKGMIMIMGQTGKKDKPVYDRVKPQNGTAVVVFKNIQGEKFNISLYHDENGNGEMEKDLFGRPEEGYALESVKIKGKKEASCNLTMYYGSDK